MAIYKNISRAPVDVDEGTIAVGAQRNIDPATDHNASWIAAGALQLVDGSVPPDPPPVVRGIRYFDDADGTDGIIENVAAGQVMVSQGTVPEPAWESIDTFVDDAVAGRLLPVGADLSGASAGQTIDAHTGLPINKADLVAGKVPAGQIPAIAISNVFPVASQAAQLALTVEVGDVAVRSDLNKSYIHNGGTAGTMADWTELLTPTDVVLSVAGRVGAVVLAQADITGLVAALAAKQDASTAATDTELASEASARAAADTTMASEITVISESPQLAKLHGWVGNGDSLDAPVTAALASLGANGGIIDLGHGDGVFSASFPSLKELRNVTLRGAGGKTAGAQAATRIIYTGTGARAIDARSSFGFKLQDLQVLYNNAGFSGSLIDFSHSISQDAAYMGIDDCYIGGVGVHTALCLLDLDKAIIGNFRRVVLTGTQYCVRGVASPGSSQYSNVHHFDSCSLSQYAQYAVLNVGEAWKFANPTVEPRIDGLAGFLTYSAGNVIKGLTIDTPWMGDATTNDWIQFPPNSYGLVINGGEIGGGSVGVRLDPGNIHGVSIKGVTFTDLAVCGVAGGGTGNENWDITDNSKAGSTPNVVSLGGTFPTGSRIQDNATGVLMSELPIIAASVSDASFGFTPTNGMAVLENTGGVRKICHRIGGTWYKATLT